MWIITTTEKKNIMDPLAMFHRPHFENHRDKQKKV